MNNSQSDLVKLLKRLTHMAEQNAITDIALVALGPDLYEHSFVIPKQEGCLVMIGELECLKAALGGHVMHGRANQGHAAADRPRIVVPGKPALVV